jgi:hypothetical protein
MPVLMVLIVLTSIFIFCGCFVCLMIFGTIIHEHYEELKERNRGKRDGEDIQADGEPNKFVRLLLKFISYQIRIFGKADFDGDSGELEKRGVSKGVQAVNEPLNVSGAGIPQEGFCFIIVCAGNIIVGAFRKLFRGHIQRIFRVKPPEGKDKRGGK